MKPLDDERLDHALLLAEEAIGRSDPNPRVGCVIGLEDGTFLGTGSTQKAGGPHAEVMAIQEATMAGQSTVGATAWVSLEPCSHHGRTPPCCEALIAAGIARVVVAIEDPNPRVAGSGLARLRAGGVSVEFGQPRHAVAAREINIGFFTQQEFGRPWVRLKTAASIDGRTALDNGASQWITGAAAREDVHHWRKRAGAVVTGIGTALADDPRMDVRLVSTELQPLRVVVDSRLRLPPTARMLAPPGSVLVATRDANQPGAATLRSAGAEVVALPSAEDGVDLEALVRELGRRGINEVHVEAGAKLSGSMVQLRLVDELLVYLAPTLLGPGRGIVHWPSLCSLDAAQRFAFTHTELVGSDLRARLQPATGPRGLPLRRKH